MRSISLIGAAALVLAGCEVKQSSPAAEPPTATSAATPLTQAAAEKIVTDAEAAWSGGRIDAVMANYAEGAVVFDTSALAPSTDRTVHTKGNAGFLTMKPADFRVDPRHVQLLDDDTIIASGVVAFTANIGAARELLRARYSQVYRRQLDGSWKIVHEHMSSPPPGTELP